MAIFIVSNQRMPISYTIDRTANLIFEKWTGNVSARDLQDYWSDYLKDEEVLSIRRTLVDLCEANLLFSTNELWGLVRGLAIPLLKGRDWKTAILVEKPVQFGVSRQYQVFAECYSQDAIFYDYDAAYQWLVSENYSQT